MFQIHTSVEQARGCGYRKPGKNGVGVYLVGPARSAGCGRLPYALDVCPTCSHGIKPSRSWTWIDPRKLFGVPDKECEQPDFAKFSSFKLRRRMAQLNPCSVCPLGPQMVDGKHGLVWIGEAFYDSPQDFLGEAQQMGISRKLPAVPKGFELGKTWVFLAHRSAVQTVGADDEPIRRAGIFSVFKPIGIDLVVDTDDPAQLPERAKKLAEQFGDGARLILVVRDIDAQQPLLEELGEAPDLTELSTKSAAARESLHAAVDGLIASLGSEAAEKATPT